MQPIKFKEMNRTLTKPNGMTDDECGPLPVFNDGERSISCWKMTWRERFSALFFGKVWLFVVMGATQPPVNLMATRTAFIEPRWEFVKEIGKRLWALAGRFVYLLSLSFSYSAGVLILLLGANDYFSNDSVQLLFFTNSCFPAGAAFILFVFIIRRFGMK